MRIKEFTYLKFLLLPFIAITFYWAVVWEIGIWHKPIDVAFRDAYPNWILLISLSIVELILLRKSLRLKLFRPKTEKLEPNNPWERKTRKQHVEDGASLGNYLKGTFGGFGERIGRIIDGFGRTKFHVHFLLRVKRIYFGLLFFFYFFLALVSLSNPAFFILFFSTAYLCIDYLWKTRGYGWRKQENKD